MGEDQINLSRRLPLDPVPGDQLLDRVNRAQVRSGQLAMSQP